MARTNRIISRTGIYHVMLRGVNKQRIFENSCDYQAMQRILLSVRTTDTEQMPVESPNYFLYAYCIMDNHIHLLIQPNNNISLGQIMKRITTAYAMHFNFLYERVGHLFQDRYRSEPVEDASYFFQLLEYIHNNPVKANYCSSPAKYRYSSFNEIAKTTQEGQSLLCSFPPIDQMLLGISEEEIRQYVLAASRKSNATFLQGIVTKLKDYTQEQNNAICNQIRLRFNWLTQIELDQMVVDTLLEMTNTKTITEFQHLDKATMRSALALVRDSGVSLKRLSHITGISIGVIRYAK